MSGIVRQLDDDAVAWITVRMHAPGTISVAGHVADKRFALKLLEHAKDAISRQVSESPIVVPNRDVVMPVAAMPLIDAGDMAPNERGDP